MSNAIRAAILFSMLLGASRANAQVAEVCGNGIDDDNDGYADEGCWPAAVMGVCENPMSCKETGDVAPKTGSLVYQLPPDLSPVVPRGPALEFKRTYMSKYAPPATNYRTAMGTRWQHNYQSWLDKSGTNVIVHLVTGQDVKFGFSHTTLGFDYYAPQAGFHAKYLRQATTAPNSWELRTMTGETYVYNWASPVGKLIEIRDALTAPNTPNKVLIAYDGAGQVTTVTDAAAKKRLAFVYTSGRVTRVNYQTLVGATATTRTDVRFVYTGTNPTTVQSTTTTIQTNVYNAAGYLTAIRDGASKDIVNFDWVAATPGMNARVTTPNGGIAYEFASARAGCVGSTVLYFNLVNASTTCNADTDCLLPDLTQKGRCGGKTAAGGTGRCYHAARCLQTTSPSEDLLTLVTPLTPCTGACAPTAEYQWTGLDLKGVKLADGNWTSYQRNASTGVVEIMVEGDTNSDATDTGGLKTWFFYDLNFPGRVTEMRRQSNISGAACDGGANDTGCKRTIYDWGATTGLLDSHREMGWTINASNTAVPYDFKTVYTYDAGRLTLTDGPLAGSDDVIERTYWTSTDVFKDGYPNEVKRKKDGALYLTTVYDGYTYWGTAGSQKDPDLSFTCRTYDANRGWLTQMREAMNGQTSCTTSNALDITTGFVRDTFRRLTRTTLPLGDCQHKEYDSFGRLTNVKLRDDCVPGNAGTNQSNTHDSNGLPIKLEYKDSAGSAKRRQESTYYDGMQQAGMLNPVSLYAQTMTLLGDGRFDTLTFENSLGKTQWLWDSQNREIERRRYKTAGTEDSWAFGYAFSPARASTTITDDMGKVTTTVSDDMGRRTKVVSPDSGTTLFVYDFASRMTSTVEAYGVVGQVTHTFTYDHLGRKLTETYGGQTCNDDLSADTEVQYTYDTVTCTPGATCSNTNGRLAHVKTVLLCDTFQPDDAVHQETFYGYDANGRVTQEYIKDDSPRTAVQNYVWDKNGNVTQVQAPSTVVMGYTYGGAGNSDTGLVSTVWRNNGATTNLLTNVQWSPLGPVTGYDQANTIGGTQLHATLSWNLAQRATQIRYNAGVANRTQIDYTEDEKGRHTSKVYSNTANAIPGTHLKYDWLDRITCDASVSGACPTSGTTLRTNVIYNVSNDRSTFYHQDPAFFDQRFDMASIANHDKIDVLFPWGLPTQLNLTWDARGNRLSEDNTNSANDRRDYTYDGRRRIKTISGTYKLNAVQLLTYVVTNAYDHRDRRVFRSFVDSRGVQSQWFFYYDLEDRLIEVKHVPNAGDQTTYSLYQWYWLGKRPVTYFGTDFPAATTARYFIHADETNRPLEVFSWPAAGDAVAVWASNPDAFGWDRVALQTIGYQPLRSAGAYFEDSTQAWKDLGSTDRPALLIQGGVVYDPMTASSLQRSGDWPNESYSLEAHNPSLGIAENGPARLPRPIQVRSKLGDSFTMSPPSHQSPSPGSLAFRKQSGGGGLGTTMSGCFRDCVESYPGGGWHCQTTAGPGFSECHLPDPGPDGELDNWFCSCSGSCGDILAFGLGLFIW